MSGKRPKETRVKPSPVETVWRLEIPAPLVARLERLWSAMSEPGEKVDPKEMSELLLGFVGTGLRSLERHHFEEERPRPDPFPYVKWWHASGQMAVCYEEAERKRCWLEVHTELEGNLVRSFQELKESAK